MLLFPIGNVVEAHEIIGIVLCTILYFQHHEGSHQSLRGNLVAGPRPAGEVGRGIYVCGKMLRQGQLAGEVPVLAVFGDGAGTEIFSQIKARGARANAMAEVDDAADQRLLRTMRMALREQEHCQY